MDNLSKNFKSLQDIDFPETTHNKIIRKLFYKQLKTPFFALFGFLLLNLIIISWRLWLNIEEADTLAILGPIFGSFELSYEYFTDLISMIVQFAPLSLVFIALINIVALVYIYRLRSEFNHLSTIGQIAK